MGGGALLIITDNVEMLEEFGVAHVRVLIKSLLPSHLGVRVVLNDVADLGSKYLFALGI